MKRDLIKVLGIAINLGISRNEVLDWAGPMNIRWNAPSIVDRSVWSLFDACRFANKLVFDGIALLGALSGLESLLSWINPVGLISPLHTCWTGMLEQWQGKAQSPTILARGAVWDQGGLRIMAGVSEATE